MRKYTLTVLLLLSGMSAYACVTCNQEIQAGIWNSQFYPNLLTMLSAFIVLAIVVAALSALAGRRHKSRLAANPDFKILSPVPLTTASMVLGIGFGGFLDGIVLHQILQLHEMLSAKVPSTDFVGKSVNMFWDGIFHFFCLLVALAGMVLLWKLVGRTDVARSGKLLAGGLLLGWGVFNIIEGLIDHHMLKLHNVVEFSTKHEVGNFVFLGSSVLMLLAGYGLVGKANKTAYAQRTSMK